MLASLKASACGCQTVSSFLSNLPSLSPPIDLRIDLLKYATFFVRRAICGCKVAPNCSLMHGRTKLKTERTLEKRKGHEFGPNDDNISAMLNAAKRTGMNVFIRSWAPIRVNECADDRLDMSVAGPRMLQPCKRTHTRAQRETKREAHVIEAS
jgi:hypothetical protein